MKKIIVSITAVCSVLIILNSCTSDNNSSSQPPVGAFLVAQISPDAPSINVNINNNVFDTGMQFGNYTPYVTAAPGSYVFSIYGSSTTPALSNTVTIDANKYFSYFIIDSFSTLKSSFINDVFKQPATDSTYIRFFNFCPNASDPLNLVDAATGSVLSANRIFNDEQLNPQYTAFTEIPAGTYSLQLKTVSGMVLKTQSIALSGGKVYSLFAKGIQGSTDTTKALSIGLLENYPQR